MNDIDKWLNDHGLGRYAETFEQNEIDSDSLLLLSDQDLREIHIPLGPRKKILAYIESLTAESSDRSTTQPEQRPLSILFCDMVESTAYAVDLGLEDYRNLTQEYLARCSKVVELHDGLVVSKPGDALVALFGYPKAHEDDAEHALEAAFEILEVVQNVKVKRGPPPQVRIGVATGLTAVDEDPDLPTGVSTFVYSYVPSLASRLQTFAQPQAILTDNTTYENTAGAFEFTDAGIHRIKGFPKPVQTWQAERARALESRFAKTTNLSELVGRDREIRLLVEHWDRMLNEGCGQVAVVSGEPGIGKSRLLYEVQQSVPKCERLMVQCSAAYSNSILHPFLVLLKRHARIHGEGLAPDNFKRLESILAKSEVETEKSLPIFAILLSIPSGSENEKLYSPSELSPVQQREITRQVLVDWIVHLARIKPVLMLVEDEQWIDPTSSDILADLIKSLSAIQMLILVTTRREALGTAVNENNLLTIRLSRLNKNESKALIRNICAEGTLSNEASASVLDKAEGVPLYVEELARATLDTEFPTESQAKGDRQSAVGVPSSLQSSLLSRLDKLGHAKEIAQVAAVIGREFNVSLLGDLCRDLYHTSDSALEIALSQLTKSGLIAPQLAANGSIYSFTHALLQDAARGLLMRVQREELHKLIALAMEKLDPKTSAAHPELLAQHFADAGLFNRAADCWLSAGLKAAETWAKVEAARMFSMGLECVKKLPVSAERNRRALQFELERGDVLYAAFGYVTGEGRVAYRNAMNLSEELGDPEAPIRALDGLFGIHFNSAQFAESEGASDRLIDIGKKRDNLKALVLGMQFKGMSLFCQGKFALARECLEGSLNYKAQADSVGSDFPSMAMIYLSWTLHILGYQKEAVELFREAECIVRQQSPYRLAACLGDGCILFAFREDNASLRRLTDELIPLAEENGFNLWLKMASFFRGRVMAGADLDADGVQLMQKTCDDLGDQEIDKSCYLGLLADTYLRLGHYEQAARTIERALEQVETTGEHYFTAELIRLRGEVQLSLNQDQRAAEDSFREARAFAQERSARSWELKATKSLAALLRSQGKLNEADRELEEIVAWFRKRDQISADWA